MAIEHLNFRFEQKLIFYLHITFVEFAHACALLESTVNNQP